MLGALVIALALHAPPSQAGERLTVLHTNDWQSSLLGFGPHADYTPDSVGDDDTTGGIARLATLIATRRAAAEGPVVLVDGGDWTMGTLFHTVTRERGTELQLLAMLGYDAVALGNHELDFRPSGLAAMIRSARAGAGAPPILATNLVLDPDHPGDDGLEALLAAGALCRTVTLDRGGLRVGLVGVLGEAAAEVMGQAAPVGIGDPVEAARAAATALRADGADFVLLLSHSGVLPDGDAWKGPEVDYAAALPEVDAIVGGHSHTPLVEAIVVDGRPVVQAGSDGRWLGELVLERTDGAVRMVSYTLHTVDDRIAGDTDVSAFIDETRSMVDAGFLAAEGLAFAEPVVRVARDLTRDFDDHVLANMVTDAYREATGSDVAVTGNGMLRADLTRGRHGVQHVSDMFRVAPLGVGTVDDSVGYALQKTWFTGADLKNMLEFLLVGAALRGPDFHPRVSGVQVVTNGWRVPFDRVVEVRVGDDTRGYTPVDLGDDRLYSVATTTYVGGFMPQVAGASYGLLDLVPRDAEGRPAAIRDLVFDGDPRRPGVQEVKAWRAVLEAFRVAPDSDGDGLGDVDGAGAVASPRMWAEDSLAPASLLAHATWRQRVALGIPAGGAVFLLAGVWGLRRRRRGGGARARTGPSGA